MYRLCKNMTSRLGADMKPNGIRPCWQFPGLLYERPIIIFLFLEHVTVPLPHSSGNAVRTVCSFNKNIYGYMPDLQTYYIISINL